MKRYCTITEESETFKRFICIDNENAEEIKEILFKDEKYKAKFKYIVRRILEAPNIYFNDYKRIENNLGIRITEMRFFPMGIIAGFIAGN
jgi:exoribonuclease II